MRVGRKTILIALGYTAIALSAVSVGLLWPKSIPFTGGTALEQPVILPALALTNAAGQPATLQQSDGKMRLSMFAYSRCQETCTALLFYLKNIYHDLDDTQRKKVDVQIITLDPQYDTPAVLRDFLNKYDKRWIGLTGNEENIDKAAELMFAANIKPQPLINEKGEQYGMSPRLHGGEIRIINPKGEFVRVYNNPEVLTGVLKRDMPALIQRHAH